MQYRVQVVGKAKPIPPNRITGRLVDVRFVPPENVDFDHVTAERVDFSGAQFGIFSAVGSRFLECDFRGAHFESGEFGFRQQSLYVGCRFEGADLRRMWMVGNVRFERCTFDNAKIHDWWADAGEFINCHFAGRITESRFSGRPWGEWLEAGRLDPPRQRNEFRDNDFREAELIGCSFVNGIDISAQLWPESDAYVRLDRLRDRINRARAIIALWPNDRERELALAMLRLYSQHGFEEQDELFARRDDMAAIPVSPKVWEILKGVPPADKGRG